MQGQPKVGWRLTPGRIAKGDLTRELFEKRIAAEARQAELKTELEALESGPLAEIAAIQQTVKLFQITPAPGSDYTKELRDALATLNLEQGSVPAPQEEKKQQQGPGRPMGSKGIPAIRRAA